jgi:ABC-type thiamin/hydroxymethylpyrimidine transport system permease subunit
MITKYRNRSLICLVLAVVLTVVIGFLIHKIMHTRVSERSGWLIAFCVIGYIVAWIAWILVGFNLASAKGYSKDFAGALFVMAYLFGFCFPPIVFAFPLFFLFGMPDKTKGRSRRH